MMPQPSSKKPIDVTAKTMKFFERMLTQFFARHMPDSTQAKPRFMKNTSMAVTITHIVSAATFKSPILVASPSGGSCGRRCCRVVRLTAAAGSAGLSCAHAVPPAASATRTATAAADDPEGRLCSVLDDSSKASLPPATLTAAHIELGAVDIGVADQQGVCRTRDGGSEVNVGGDFEPSPTATARDDLPRKQAIRMTCLPEAAPADIDPAERKDWAADSRLPVSRAITPEPVPAIFNSEPRPEARHRAGPRVMEGLKATAASGARVRPSPLPNFEARATKRPVIGLDPAEVAARSQIRAALT